MFSLAIVLALAVCGASAQQDQQWYPQQQPQQQQQQQAPQVYSSPSQIYYLPPNPTYYQPVVQPVVQPVIQQVPVQRVQADPVYAYIPPSPLAPPCPDSYTCCGGVKTYDPQGTKQCCGVRFYTPQLQSCANGQVVTIVQAQPPPPTTPLPVYVQRAELVCEGIRWQVPYPNYKCCGPSVYNTQSETCNDNGVVGQQRQQASVGQQQYYAQQTMFPVDSAQAKPAQPPAQPTTKLLICQGRRYSVPAPDYQFYACCGYESYFWIREQCINGQISPPRPTTTTTSATPIAVPTLLVCDTTQHWVSAEDRQYIGCCGSDVYDVRVDQCRAPYNPTQAGSIMSNPSTCAAGFICCENYPAVDNSNGNLQCCPGVGPYDPSISNCPGVSGKK